MKRLIFVAIAVMLFAIESFAQADANIYRFRYLEDKMDLSELSANGSYDHIFGERVGKKMSLLQKTYTWREEPTPTNPGIYTIIEKPEIYNNVKKLEKYYKKMIKKGSLTKADAAEEFENALDIALLVRYQDTEAFETYLRGIKAVEEIASVFTDKVELTYY